MRRLISFNETPNSSRHQLEQLPNHNFPSLGIIPVIEGGTRVIMSWFYQLTFHLQSWQTGPKHIFSAKNLKFEDKVQEALKSNYVKSKGLKEKAEFLVLRFSKLYLVSWPLSYRRLCSLATFFNPMIPNYLPTNSLPTLSRTVQICATKNTYKVNILALKKIVLEMQLVKCQSFFPLIQLKTFIFHL